MSTYKCVIIIYLVASSPIHSSVLPKSTTGSRIAFSWTCFGWGLHLPLLLPAARQSLTLPFHPYQHMLAVYFCCTSLGVTSTGRYPASCPVKPGLSSPAAFRQLQPQSSVLLSLFQFVFSFTIRNTSIRNWASLPSPTKRQPYSVPSSSCDAIRTTSITVSILSHPLISSNMS